MIRYAPAFVLLLSACTVDTIEIPVQTVPVATAPVVKTTTSTTTTTVKAPDGTTVVTRVEPSRPQGVRAFVGPWQAKDIDGSTCSLTLSSDDFFGSRRVSGACIGDKLMGVSNWQLRGSKVVLLNGFGEEIATLTQTEPNLLEGGGISMWR